jgi:hypothetical protein
VVVNWSGLLYHCDNVKLKRFWGQCDGTKAGWWRDPG